MSRWFRHYAGLCRDEKLVSVSIKAKQPIERVVWVWCAILESAAEVDNNGRFGVDTAEIAYFLRTDEADIQSILDNLQALGRVDENHVVKWGNRQFQSDRSRERVAAYRERKRQGNDANVQQEPSRNGDVSDWIFALPSSGDEDFRRTQEWRNLRTVVFSRDDYTCTYCGARGVSLQCDHIIPVARGGDHDLRNLTTACRSCNISKRDKLVREWLP